jgi:methylated-DNA-[protein]-cysteine S-methyltransferase
MILYTHVDSPVGRLLLLSDEKTLTGLYMDVPGHEPAGRAAWRERPEAGPLRAAAEQLSDYFTGTRRRFDLPLGMPGTPFQRRVWQELSEIPFGETLSYGRLATRIGKPGAARAVGLANNRNPISIIVPCHRVIGADGSLTGYGGGLDRKRWLLAHEAGTDPWLMRRPAQANAPGSTPLNQG